MTLLSPVGSGALTPAGVTAFVAGVIPRLSQSRAPAARWSRPRDPLGVPSAGRCPPPRQRVSLAAFPPTPPHSPASTAAAAGSVPSTGKAKAAPAGTPPPAPTPQSTAAPGPYGGSLPSPGGEPSSSPSPGPGGQPPQRPPDYYANVGKVIETLRADYPALPRRSPCLSIYSPSVTFSAKHLPGGVRMPALHGLDAYGALLWATRAHVRVLLVAPSVRVLSLYHDVPGGRLYLRWRLAGTPRYVAVVARGSGGGGRSGRESGGGPAWMFDGMSVYHLGNDGWVAAHELDPNVWNKRKLQSVQAALAGGLGRQQLARARGRGIAAGVAGYPQLWWEGEEDGGCEASTSAAPVAAADARSSGVAGADAAASTVLVPPGGADLGGGAAL
ncbi:hypothetical protein MMPV_006152 [Pyropia vietnamensis]